MSLVAILPQQDPSIFLIRTSNFLLELGKKAEFIKVEAYSQMMTWTCHKLCVSGGNSTGGGLGNVIGGLTGGAGGALGGLAGGAGGALGGLAGGAGGLLSGIGGSIAGGICTQFKVIIRFN